MTDKKSEKHNFPSKPLSCILGPSFFFLRPTIKFRPKKGAQKTKRPRTLIIRYKVLTFWGDLRYTNEKNVRFRTRGVT